MRFLLWGWRVQSPQGLSIQKQTVRFSWTHLQESSETREEEKGPCYVKILLMKQVKTIAVAMSGGVDSSTTAALLKKEGHNIIGITMRLYTGFSACCGLSDVEDARKVAEDMGFPFHVISFEKEFAHDVIDRFVGEYLKGRTPNPCVLCNQQLKFNFLLDKARELGADYLATGHYARNTLDSATGQYQLRKASDLTKDQSYFLFTMGQEILSRILFPLGEFTKEETRNLAKDLGLRIHKKRESQDICFVPSGDYVPFIESWMHARKEFFRDPLPGPGPFVDPKGRVLGLHQGIYRYTVGQRSGLGIALGTPVYVKEINVEENKIILGSIDEIHSDSCRVTNVSWVSGEAPTGILKATVKVRYRHPGVESEISEESNGGYRIQFQKPQRAVTPGQAAVFYLGDKVIGGGWITKG